MTDKKRPGPTNVFALADGNLFASFTRIRCIIPGDNRLKLFLDKQPKSVPGPLWLHQIRVLIDDPVKPFRSFAYIEDTETVNGELFLVTDKLGPLPLSESMAKRLSKESMLVFESPFGKKQVLNFHALLRAKRKNTSSS